MRLGKINSRDLFSVICLIIWPLNESEGGVDPAWYDNDLPAFIMLIMLFSCKLVGMHIRKAVRFL